MNALALLAAACVAVLAACAAEEPRHAAAALSARPLLAAQQCGRESPQPRALWLDDQAALDRAVRRVRRNVIGAPPPPPVDFSREAVVLLELGRRPTAGYQPRLASRLLVLSGGDALLSVSLSSPGAYAAQVVTSPCLLVAVQRGNYDEVEVTSTEGSIRVRAARIAR